VIDSAAGITTAAPGLRVLLRGLVDYAGLFPPASQDMTTAATEYAEHRFGPDAWMLGRFILPAARIDEFESTASAVLPRQAAASWALSALLGSDVEQDIERIERFNERHRDARNGAVLVDTVELKAHSPRDVSRAAELLDRRFDTYMEIPTGDATTELVSEIARTTAKAKIRMGGVTAEAFPSSLQVARFLGICIERGVGFKATAGLHHPWRAEYRLTYATDAPTGEMFGFLNLLLAIAILRAGRGEELAVAALEERDPRAARFIGDGITWRSESLSMRVLAEARESLSAIGSCSFSEPVSDLRTLHVL
jgi:hypothetical protein